MISELRYYRIAPSSRRPAKLHPLGGCVLGNGIEADHAIQDAAQASNVFATALSSLDRPDPVATRILQQGIPCDAAHDVGDHRDNPNKKQALCDCS